MAAFTTTCPAGAAATTVGTMSTRHREESLEDLVEGACDWEDREGGDGEGGHNAMAEKTHEFFQICDKEEKGFITRRDMQVNPPTVWDRSCLKSAHVKPVELAVCSASVFYC